MSGPVRTDPVSADAQPIAVIGMSGRFPGARDVVTFWDNLCGGVESIARFSVDELLARGHDPAIVGHPRFVPAEGVLDDIASFDAAFFGYSPREAEVMDPQHRLCLETAWEAFGVAGYDPAAIDGAVGVFLSASLSSYLVRNLLPNRELLGLLGGFPLLIHNDKDFVATTVSHKLGLTGPSMAVGSACSSSLVAVHLACQSLHTYESDVALAGGVSLQVPQPQGYVHSDDGIYSPDGHCRAFDAAAAGTVGGSGVGVVLLKRLADARRDRDHVHAVLLGSAVNNDGAAKVGYTAPGVDGQTAVIAEAHEAAGITADQVGYVEAHGTGTRLGDTVEIEALTRAFRRTTQGRGFCAVGSVKTNIGHLDAAAGVAALIKTVLAVEHGMIPASLNHQRPNPHLDLPSTPFYVNTATRPWPSSRPRTAGVSAFGIGGTNAHVVVGEASAVAPASGAPRPWQPLLFSAHDDQALRRAGGDLAAHLRAHPEAGLADTAFSLAGRRAFRRRRAVVCADTDSAAAALAGSGVRDFTGEWTGQPRPLVFLLAGQGSYQPRMAAGLYRDEPAFRAHLDGCAGPLAELGIDLDAVLDAVLGAAPHDRPDIAQPALFAVGYALASTLREWGLEPAALLGHGLGEYVAATVAGVLSVDDAVRLVGARGRLCAELPPGRMLAVPLGFDAMPDGVPDLVADRGMACAADNGPDQCVIAGPPPAVAELAAMLARRGIRARPLAVTRAYHSAAVEPLLDRFLDAARGVTPRPPRTRYVSNLTGDWVDPADVVQPEYWVRHLRETVRFGAGTRAVLGLPDAIVLEVAASATLSPLVRRHPACTPDHLVLACQPGPGDPEPPAAALTSAVAQAWVAGAPVRWDRFHASQPVRRVPCPPYPLDRRRFWVDPPRPPAEPDGLSGLVRSLERHVTDIERAHPIRGIDEYPGLRAGLDELCAALALRYLAVAGVDTAPGSRHPVGQLCQRLGVLAGYQKFVRYMLTMLAEDGIVSRDGDAVVFLERAADADPERLAGRITDRHPRFRGLVELLAHCGAHLPRALSSPGAALDVLYPGGRGDLLRRSLGEQTVEHTRTGHLVAAVAELAGRLAGTRPRLRVLEVGAGGGRLTFEVAGALRDRPVDYLVTDIGRLFVEDLAGEARRRRLGFVRTGTLDIVRDPAAQGFVERDFDLIVGLDVVHATPDVRASLVNLRSLLAPAGLLALVETTAADRWQSMIWGLSEDWWCFEDDLRDGQPLLAAGQWSAVVSEPGFAASAVLPRPVGAPADTSLILAQAPPGQGTAQGGLPAKRPDPGDWLYLPSWTRTAPPTPSAGGRCLVLADGSLGEAVAHRLRERGMEVVVARPGGAFGAAGDAYTVDPARPEDYRTLLDELAGRPPSHVAHLWGADATTGPITVRTIDDEQSRCLHSLLWLAQAHGSQQAPSLRRLLAVTSGAQDVLGGDLVHPEQAMANAAVKVIPREYPDLACSAVDLPAERTPAQESWLADRVVEELLAMPETPTVAYRGRHRWRPAFTPLRTGASPGPRAGGVYLITGGLGGIGLALGEFLLRLPAAVVLTGRTPFPAREDWQEYLRAHPADAVSTTIRRLLAAEAEGGRVLVSRADVTSVSEMRQVVDRMVALFGPVTGVVHAAGVTDEAGMIQRRTRADTDRAIAAKVRGTVVLDRVLDTHDVDFFVLCSSLGPILYKLKFGEVGYVAGNEFLTAFAAHRAARGHRGTVAVSWTDWLDAGMWARARERLDRYELTGPDTPWSVRPVDDLLRGITEAEGVEVFRRILAQHAGSHVVVSTQDLDALLARHEAFTTSAHRELIDRLQLAARARPRPGPGGPRVPPQTPEETAIAAMWQALLGVSEVGARDDFFELGGDSLLALRFLSRLREEFGVEHPIAAMFNAPTVRAVAAEVVRARDRPADGGQEEVLL